MHLEAAVPRVFAIVFSIAWGVFRPRGGLNCVHQVFVVMSRVGYLIGQMPAWAQLGSNLRSRQLVGTACFGTERLLVWVPECAAGAWPAKCARAVVAFGCTPDCSAQGSLQLFTSDVPSSYLVGGLDRTGWLGDGWLGHRGGVAASGTVASATGRWLPEHARAQGFSPWSLAAQFVFSCAVPVIFPQLVFLCR